MRIMDVLSSIGDVQKKKEKKALQAKDSPLLFASTLERQQDENGSYEHEIDTLRKEIEQAGKKLQQEATLPNFIKFRDLLSSLAKRVSAEAYRLEKIGGTPQNPRYYEIITVDRKSTRLNSSH